MNYKSKRYFIDGTLIGSALFSMFFGAGNMIFPPYLGLKSGTEWVIAFISYFIADIGFALLAVFAIIKNDNNSSTLSPLGKYASLILTFAVFMCIGPLITIPRTAATTYELAIKPLNVNFNVALFYILFFLIVFILCYKKSAVVDIVGKFLTPLLFIGLLFLIALGIFANFPTISTAPRSASVIADGVEAGYQSMDVLGGMVFGVLILNSIKQKGYRAEKSKLKITAISGAVSGIGLLIIYWGLTYLGAAVSSEYSLHISRAELLTNIISKLIPGTAGTLFFGIIAGLACLSTAIALTSAVAEYLSNLTKNKISYKNFVIMICIFDILISLLGVDKLVSLASPILSVIYPPILVMIILSLIYKNKGKWKYRIAAATATIISVFDVLNFRFIYSLPLSHYGFAWLIPTLFALLIGIAADFYIYKRKAL